MESANAIELKKISKYFGEVIANKNISLEVRKGEILSLLGENGSGKTTLMNMLAGIYFPDEGEIIIDGKEVKITCPADAFQLGIGMIHQHFKLIETFTAAENIILGLPGKEIIKMNEVVEKINGLVNKYGFELDPNKKNIQHVRFGKTDGGNRKNALQGSQYTHTGRTYGSAYATGNRQTV